MRSFIPFEINLFPFEIKFPQIDFVEKSDVFVIAKLIAELLEIMMIQKSLEFPNTDHRYLKIMMNP